MKNVLALDTSTDACSASWRCAGRVESRFEVIPRQHNHRLFSMLAELLPEGAHRADVELLSFARGPGSFTGLRIAASAIQGLAYTLDLPVAAVSTLACLAQSAYRRGALAEGEAALVLLDARINEVYWGLYRIEHGLARSLVEDQVAAPADLPEQLNCDAAVALGSGLAYLDQLPAALHQQIQRTEHEQWPDSVDLLPLADQLSEAGATVSAAAVQPVYLRNEIHWKKLSEQGRRNA